MTSNKGIFVAGDLAGVEEASIAMEEGILAGMSVIKYLGVSEKNVSDRKIHSLEQLRKKGKNELPSFNLDAYREYDKPKAVIECFEGIPCNPCEKHCPFGAITIGDDIINLPKINLEKCTGCGRCVVSCPGMACFLINLNYSTTEAEIAIPYEYLPLPKQDEIVRAVSRSGDTVCNARVIRTKRLVDCDNTMLLCISVPKEYAVQVRSIERKEQSLNENV